MKRISTLLILALLLAQSLLFSQEKETLAVKIDSLCNAVFNEWNLPGLSIAVVKGGEELFLKGYGKGYWGEGGEEVTPETQFVIASTSKAMTAALLATLVERGDIKWEDSVVNHLPDFKLYDPWVTQNFLVKDIMVHKTGFKAYAGDDLPHFGYNREELYRLFAQIRPTYSFRTTYAYNNGIYNVAAKLIEKYYGVSWEEAIEEYLFKPLGMSSSTTGKEAYWNSKRLARGYRHYLEGDSIKFSERVDRESAYRWLSAIAPAGFVVTTGRDMVEWLKFHLNGGEVDGTPLLSKENYKFLVTPQTISGSDSTSLTNYAQGWTVEQGSQGKIIRHTGLAYGYTAVVALMPTLNMGVAILTNGGNTVNPHMAICRELIDMVNGEQGRDWREHYLSSFIKSGRGAKRAPKERGDSIAPRELELYVGSYTQPNFGEVTISLKEKQLNFALKEVSVPLTHISGDKFSISVSGVGRVEVTFFQGVNSPIESLTFDLGDPIGNFYKRAKD